MKESKKSAMSEDFYQNILSSLKLKIQLPEKVLSELIQFYFLKIIHEFSKNYFDCAQDLVEFQMNIFNNLNPREAKEIFLNLLNQKNKVNMEEPLGAQWTDFIVDFEKITQHSLSKALSASYLFPASSDPIFKTKILSELAFLFRNEMQLIIQGFKTEENMLCQVCKIKNGVLNIGRQFVCTEFMKCHPHINPAPIEAKK